MKGWNSSCRSTGTGRHPRPSPRPPPPVSPNPPLATRGDPLGTSPPGHVPVGAAARRQGSGARPLGPGPPSPSQPGHGGGHGTSLPRPLAAPINLARPPNAAGARRSRRGRGGAGADVRRAVSAGSEPSPLPTHAHRDPFPTGAEIPPDIAPSGTGCPAATPATRVGSPAPRGGTQGGRRTGCGCHGAPRSLRPEETPPSLPQFWPARLLAGGPVSNACSDCLFPLGCWMRPSPKENKESASISPAPPSRIRFSQFGKNPCFLAGAGEGRGRGGHTHGAQRGVGSPPGGARRWKINAAGLPGASGWLG